MSKIYFIRHGQSQANADMVLAGASDSPLTDLGRQQAVELALRIVATGTSIDTVISSPQIRALETARIVCSELGIPEQSIRVIDELREKGSGSYEGRAPEYMVQATEEDMQRAGGETLALFAERVRRSHQKVNDKRSGTTLVVGHSEWNRMSRCLSDNRPPSDMHTYSKPANGQLLDYPLIENAS